MIPTMQAEGPATWGISIQWKHMQCIVCRASLQHKLLDVDGVFSWWSQSL